MSYFRCRLYSPLTEHAIRFPSIFPVFLQWALSDRVTNGYPQVMGDGVWCTQIIVQMEHDTKQEWSDVMIVPAGALMGNAVQKIVKVVN